MSLYEAEVRFTVFSVTVSDVKHVDAGEQRVRAARGRRIAESAQ